MNTLSKRTFVVGIILAVAIVLTGFTIASNNQATLTSSSVTIENSALVSTFAESHDISLYAPDAELYISGQDQPIIGHEAIADFLMRLYGGHGYTLGASIVPQRTISLSDSLVYFEYIYQATAFLGDVVPVETMLDSVNLEVPMVSIFEIQDGLIIREFLFEGELPQAVAANYN